MTHTLNYLFSHKQRLSPSLRLIEELFIPDSLVDSDNSSVPSIDSPYLRMSRGAFLAFPLRRSRPLLMPLQAQTALKPELWLYWYPQYVSHVTLWTSKTVVPAFLKSVEGPKVWLSLSSHLAVFSVAVNTSELPHSFVRGIETYLTFNSVFVIVEATKKWVRIVQI